MPSCVSCRVPHHTEDCDQHKPPNAAVSGQPWLVRGWRREGSAREEGTPTRGSSCRGRR